MQRALFRADCLRAQAGRLRVASVALRDEARRLRRHRPGADVGFHLEGLVDGSAVWADWTPGGLATCLPLRQRADLVVALGDSIGDPGLEVPACLDGSPTSALLTLMRACDRVCSVSLHIRSLASDDEIDELEDAGRGPEVAGPGRLGTL